MDGLRQASAATGEARRPVQLDQASVGRLSRMDAMQQQSMAAAQEARRQARGRALEAAIRRIESDEFGWCDLCGEFIGEKRLDVDPTLTRCVGCAR
ncbi:TraR/DksA family transcriptional regulator [Rhodovulum steppense]|uniref:TraR/DksA family transcriptional regulator n=1 Tax=Rhodovulum steppense TaxID=540251 RepID=A0A4R1Z2X9_9RHOB|nr:TraR/DksA C4-type zinc finger protein [Rhodovulum steppense]TCM87563.1 TraR/DksA family transcriptional regulator [Rhodovulum steppense]